jgi:hypothetical protein
MDHKEMAALGAGTAAWLGQMRGESWKVGDSNAGADTDFPWVDIANPGNGAVLRLIWGLHAEERVTVEGRYPEGIAHAVRRANVDPGRGAMTVAREANRRVLLAGYLDDLPAVLARKAAQDRREAARELLMARAAELFGVEPDGGKVYLGQWLDGSGTAEAYMLTDPESISLDLSGVRADVALRMLAVMAAHAPMQPTCCVRYGEGHPPGWAEAGCRQRGIPAPDTLPAELEPAYDAYVLSGEWREMPFKAWLKAHPV